MKFAFSFSLSLFQQFLSMCLLPALWKSVILSVYVQFWLLKAEYTFKRLFKVHVGATNTITTKIHACHKTEIGEMKIQSCSTIHVHTETYRCSPEPASAAGLDMRLSSGFRFGPEHTKPLCLECLDCAVHQGSHKEHHTKNELRGLWRRPVW